MAALNRPTYGPARKANLSRIKTDFVSGVLRRDAEFIRSEQQKVAKEWSLFKDGNLQRSLQGHFSVGDAEAGNSLSMSYLNYARFLDMPGNRRSVRTKRREGYHLYNRTVFGIIYNRTMPSIKYGFTDEVKEQIEQTIAESAGQNPLLKNLVIKNISK